MKISVDKVVRAMSIALDLAQMSSQGNTYNKPIIEKVTNVNYSNHRFIHHSQRTCYIALKLAECLELSDEIKKSTYVVSLLHDIGAANYLYESHSSELFIKAHCLKGAEITKNFPGFDEISNIILCHHENVDGSGAIGLKEENIPIQSQLIRISDLTELLYREDENVFRQKHYIRNWIKHRSKIIFSEKIVNAFLDVSSKDIFWLDMQNISFMDVILDRVRPKLNIYFNLNEFEIIAGIFANIIDDKSKFTATHSKGIAKLAYLVSVNIGYNKEKCIKMKIAGLLHDIGKLAIPINILDKNGSLTPEEFEIIKSHVYYTKIILDKIEDIPDISEWASNHHEKLNGRGYPSGLKAEDLSEESRIMAVCDIYQALTENRPYRDGLQREEVFSIMDNMVEGGFICKNAFQNLKSTLNSLDRVVNK